MENFKEFFERIEHDFDNPGDGLLYFELKKVLKYFLASEYYYKKIFARELSDYRIKEDIHFLYSSFYQFYHESSDYHYYGYFPHGQELIEDFHYMFQYNKNSIENAKQLKHILKSMDMSDLINKHTYGTSVFVRKLLSEIYQINISELLSKRFGKNEDNEYFKYLIKSISDEVTKLNELSYIMSDNEIIKYIFSSAINKIDSFIDARQSFTRGMEAGCPIPYVKGTICIACFTIVAINDLISWMKRKEYDYCHLVTDGVEEEKPPVSLIDDAGRNFLLTVGGFTGIVWFNGCKPTNY